MFVQDEQPVPKQPAQFDVQDGVGVPLELEEELELLELEELEPPPLEEELEPELEDELEPELEEPEEPEEPDPLDTPDATQMSFSATATIATALQLANGVGSGISVALFFVKPLSSHTCARLPKIIFPSALTPYPKGACPLFKPSISMQTYLYLFLSEQRLNNLFVEP